MKEPVFREEDRFLVVVGGRISEDREGSLERGQDNGVAERLAGEHRQCRDPGVAAHQPQNNGQRLADGRQEGEEPHHGPAPCEELAGPGQLARGDAQTGDPLRASERSDPVAGHAAEGVARRGGHEAPYGVKPHAHQNDHDRFGTERQDAPGDQRRDEKAPVAPVDEKLRYGFHAGKDTKYLWNNLEKWEK